MSTVVTLTMNPSLDLFAHTPKVVDDGKSRCHTDSLLPGGGGINVARNLRQLGVDVLAIFPAGGLQGQVLQHQLRAEELPFRCIDIAGDTRQNLAITELASNRMFHFVFAGPALAPAEVQACIDAIKRLPDSVRYLVLSGSLPEGIPDDFFAPLCEHAYRYGIRIILDTSGRALSAPMQAGVFLAKLNRHEFADLGYNGPENYPSMLDAMAEMVARGQAEALIVTLDAAGALLATRDGQRLHLRPPPTPVISHVGAGDAFVTLLVYQLLQDGDLVQAFHYGVAAAAAKVNTPGNQLPGLNIVDAFVPQLQSARVPSGSSNPGH